MFPERSAHRFTAECTRLEFSLRSVVYGRAQRAIDKNYNFFDFSWFSEFFVEFYSG